MRIMQREILIIDDHDDMATALEEVFVATGHYTPVTPDEVLERKAKYSNREIFVAS